MISNFNGYKIIFFTYTRNNIFHGLIGIYKTLFYFNIFEVEFEYRDLRNSLALYLKKKSICSISNLSLFRFLYRALEQQVPKHDPTHRRDNIWKKIGTIF